LTSHLVLLIAQYGLLIVALNVFLDQIGLPVPAMPTLVVAGAMSAAGNLALAPLFTASVLACLVPDCTWFLIGRVYGVRVLKTLCRVSLEPDSCVSQTQSRFERWGVNSLVIAKFVPGLAIIAPPLAGAMRIGWARFVVLSICGGTLWVGSGLIAGHLFKEQIALLLVHLDRIGSIVGAIAVALLLAYIAYKWWQRMRFYRALRMARISVVELFELMRSGAKPIVVDVRSPTARALEPRWIPGAIHVPVDAVGAHVEHLPRDKEIVVYCTCPSEASAARVAKILINHGFILVRPLLGGLDAWIAAGYNVEDTAGGVAVMAVGPVGAANDSGKSADTPAKAAP
jgi:membrane protein DedA with SNARE-associated domain/rhodanese-related sulfurtransferase